MWKVVLVAAVTLSCASSEPHDAQADVCVPVQWEACPHPCGTGVRHCEQTDSGPAWSACACVVPDLTLPEAPAGGAGGGAGSGP